MEEKGKITQSKQKKEKKLEKAATPTKEVAQQTAISGTGIKQKLEQSKKTLQEKKEKRKKKITLSRKQIIILSVVLTSFVLISLVIYLIVDHIKYNNYYPYEEKMKIYGFDLMYDNKNANTKETVTLSEVIKMAIVATFNIDKISYESVDYPNQGFVQYAIDQGLVVDVGNDNQANKASYADAITIFSKCKIQLLKKQAQEKQIEIKDINLYNSDVQTYIKDLLASDIIPIYGDTIHANQKVFKGQVNEIIINYVEKYNLIAMEGEKLNINPEKLPSNYQEFPYIVTNIAKEVYEYPTVEKGTDKEPRTAAQIYRYKKDSYLQIKDILQDFFNTLLNIDYKTINAQDFETKINQNIIFKERKTNIEKYVKYVKENEIILKGEAVPQLPIFYFNGVNYFARLKINLVVQQSKTDKNLIYLDTISGIDTIYADKNYEFYIDYPLTEAIGNRNFYLKMSSLYGCILDVEKVNITKGE